MDFRGAMLLAIFYYGLKIVCRVVWAIAEIALATAQETLNAIVDRINRR